MKHLRTDLVDEPHAAPPKNRRWVDPKNNSLNLIRLLMAMVVVVHHIYPITGRGDGHYLASGETMGAWAVFVFFMISGYLITGSRLRSDGGKYLINRIVRIFPAFFFINIVTAFVLAPIAFVVQNGTISGFLTTETTPLSYVMTNAWLRMNDYSIAGTLAEVPYPHAWNGSLWSLYYEFTAYLVVGLILVFPFARKSAWPMAIAFLASVAVKAVFPAAVGYASSVSFDLSQYARLFPFFFGGGLVFMLKDKLQLSIYGAVGAACASAALIWLSPEWGAQMAAPFLTYVILWIADAVPSPRFFQVHDFSYGVYIWGFPLTQMAALFGFHHASVPVLSVALIASTLVGAAISWFLIERPMLRWARGKAHPFGDIRAEAR